MTAPAGWYPDPSGEGTTRYWDGTRWTHVEVGGVAVASEPRARAESARQESDGASVAPPPPPPPIASPPPASAAAMIASLRHASLQLSAIAWLVFAGCAAAAIGALLPWEQATMPFGVKLTAGPADSAGGVIMLWALLAAVVWIAWPVRVGKLLKNRLVGLTAVVALLSMFMIAKWAGLADAQSSSSDSTFGEALQVNTGPGLGLFLYSAGMVAIWVGVVRSWLGFGRQVGSVS